MSLQVNKELSAQENLTLLVQHTWEDAAEFLTEDHVTIEGGIPVDGSTSRLGVTITGISEEVIGVKNATYECTDLTNHSFSFDEVDDAAAAAAAVTAYIADNLACLPEEVEVSAAQLVDGQFRVDVSAVEGAITCAGSKVVWVPQAFQPLDLATDLEGDQLDGFEQIAQQ